MAATTTAILMDPVPSGALLYTNYIGLSAWHGCQRMLGFLNRYKTLSDCTR